MFNFDHQRNDQVLLNVQDGTVASITRSGNDDDGTLP
jgi:hypothetical protein